MSFSIEEKWLLQFRVALVAAAKAGAYFKSRLYTELQVKAKTSLADVVTDVDPACERMIRNTIHQIFPTHQILGEESVAPGAIASAAAIEQVQSADFLWIIDPLDGTSNFVSGIPLSVVSIAYAEQGQVRVGVIYDPYREEFFTAMSGHGVRRFTLIEADDWIKEGVDWHVLTYQTTGIKAQVSQVMALERATVATGFPVRSGQRDRLMERGVDVIARAKSFRALGAAALHLAYVAMGRLDVFWEYDLNAWDLAAGVFLVAEAGGHIVNLHTDNIPFTLTTRDILVAGQAQLLSEVRLCLVDKDSSCMDG